MGLAAALSLAPPGLAHAQALDLVYERTVMTAADARCGLFTPEVSAALLASQAQARGAALRAGASADALAAVVERARRRASTGDCDSLEFTTAAARVRGAFAGYARVQRLSYPGERAGWNADRAGPGQIRWRLVQDAAFGDDRLKFGLAGRTSPGVLLALAQFADGRTPFAARLLLRDSRRSEAPYFDSLVGEVRGLPLARRLPPRSALRIYTAEARSPAGSDLLPKGARSGWAFRFPASAAADLAGLDPREAVAVEFLFEGDVVRRAYVEVGDFAAGRAFLTLAR
jgi:hypothetical protein